MFIGLLFGTDEIVQCLRRENKISSGIATEFEPEDPFCVVTLEVKSAVIR
jgi:hypothetical protein